MTTTNIQWAWGQNQQINFNPATDKLDFGWFQSGQFTVSELNGSVVISIPSNQQTYTLNAISLADLDASNIVARDTATLQVWLDVLDGQASDGSSVVSDTVIPPVVDVTPAPVPNPLPEPIGGSTFVVSWAWGQQTNIGFNPVSDKLDFGWNFQSGQFTMAESNGSTVISIPSNQQAVTLTGVTLSELTASNFLSHDPGVLTYISGVIGAVGSENVTPTEPDSGSTVPAGSGSGGSSSPATSAYAQAWDADEVYTAGQKVSFGDKVYEAKWWTQHETPVTEGNTAAVWSFVGFMNTTPVVPDAPQHLLAPNVTAQSAMLVWDAAQVNGVGTVSGYGIFEDGVLIGTTQATYYTVAGLEPTSTHSFTVEAYDEVGASLRSTPISVTTDAPSSLGFDQFFSPYVDMSLSKSQQIAQTVEGTGLDHLTMAFLVNSGVDQIGWGGVGNIQNDGLPAGSSVLNQVQSLQHQGVDVTISFGGAVGSEPALVFSSVDALTRAYQSVIDRYHVNSLDFDIEGAAIANTAANHMRDEALVALDKANPDLQISFTLPVMPTGLTAEGINLLKQMKADGVPVDVINIMAMDYGAAADSGDMGQDAIDAALATISQIRDSGLSAKVGITPMIGINDVQSEIFSQDDAHQLMAFAKDNPDVASIGMWSLGRDTAGQLGLVSPVSSGIAQAEYDFIGIFGAM